MSRNVSPFSPGHPIVVVKRRLRALGGALCATLSLMSRSIGDLPGVLDINLKNVRKRRTVCAEVSRQKGEAGITKEWPIPGHTPLLHTRAYTTVTHPGMYLRGYPPGHVPTGIPTRAYTTVLVPYPGIYHCSGPIPGLYTLVIPTRAIHPGYTHPGIYHCSPSGTRHIPRFSLRYPGYTTLYIPTLVPWAIPCIYPPWYPGYTTPCTQPYYTST